MTSRRRRAAPHARSPSTSAVALAALLALVPACGAPEPGVEDPAGEGSASPERPNLLLVTVDTLRANRTSLYAELDAAFLRSIEAQWPGDPASFATPTGATPALASLAREGLLFERAYAHSSTTAPSHATLFTGLYPLAHGVDKNGRRLAPELSTLAELLARAGYETAGFVGSYVLIGRFGFAQGFEHWNDDVRAPRPGQPCGERVLELCADQVADRAVAWLEQRSGDRPFFLFAHYFDPHGPYEPPARFAREASLPAAESEGEGGLRGRLAELVASYDGEVAFADHEIGRLLAALDAQGLRDETLVVVAADHGEGMGQHGILSHGAGIYEELVRIPLLLRWPGRIAPGRRVEAPVGLVDLLPSLLEMLELDADGLGLQGASLAGAVLRGEPLSPTRPVYLQRRHYEPETSFGRYVAGVEFGVRRGRWKYSEAEDEGRHELYDLEADPAELRNLVAEEPARAAELRAELVRWRAERARPVPEPGPISPEDRARLEALGYAE